MDLTIDQALKKAIEAHKKGLVQEADRLYTAILKAYPNHPDANHNLGVLAVSLRKIEQALPFFQKAIAANPKVPQFWISQINALIKLERISDAKWTFEQAIRNGVDDEGLEKLANILGIATKDNTSASDCYARSVLLRDSGQYNEAITLLTNHVEATCEDPKIFCLLAHCYILKNDASNARLALDKAKYFDPSIAMVGWNEARILLKELDVENALTVVKNTLKFFPDDAEGLGVLGACLRIKGNLEESLKVLNHALNVDNKYAEAFINRGLVHLSLKNKRAALSDLEHAYALKPHMTQIWTPLISLKMDMRDFSGAITFLKRMIEIDPNDEKKHASLALCHQKLGEYPECIKAYQTAISINPDYADAYFNLGSAFKKVGRREEAIKNYEMGLKIKPADASVFYNMGVTYYEAGKIEEAVDYFTSAINIKPNFAEVAESLSILSNQLNDIVRINHNLEKQIETQNMDMAQRPRFHIQQAIRAFLDDESHLLSKHLNNYQICDPKSIAQLDRKEQIFCAAYYRFLSKLLQSKNLAEPKLKTRNEIFHFGESHCLSYAHQKIKINGELYRIVPNITFGAKAFHFSRKESDAFKAITRENFASLPHYSNVFISFGEIDCRSDEGFIPSAKKLKKTTDELIASTVNGFINWFSRQNEALGHRLFFFNVPAPAYNDTISSALNIKVCETVLAFNEALEKKVSENRFKLIDVHSFTANEQGFSNKKYHIDGHHLGPKAIRAFETQLTHFS